MLLSPYKCIPSPVIMNTSDFSATLKHNPRKFYRRNEIRRTVKYLLLLAVLDYCKISLVKLLMLDVEFPGLLFEIRFRRAKISWQNSSCEELVYGAIFRVVHL